MIPHLGESKQTIVRKFIQHDRRNQCDDSERRYHGKYREPYGGACEATTALQSISLKPDLQRIKHKGNVYCLDSKPRDVAAEERPIVLVLVEETTL